MASRDYDVEAKHTNRAEHQSMEDPRDMKAAIYEETAHEAAERGHAATDK